jgi:hypothetical protein
VAHQVNFLVAHHFARIVPPIPADRLVDAGACLVLERASAAGPRARLRLAELDVCYQPRSILENAHPGTESPTWNGRECGPASLPLLLSVHGGGDLEHRLESRDGITARSVWCAA